MIGYVNFPAWLRPEVISGFPIRWYGLMYLLAFFITFQLFFFIAVKERRLNTDKDTILNLFFWGVLAVLIGGRIFSVLIYDPTGYYLDNPIDIFKIWEGGMSFHGGLLGVIVGTHIFAKSIKTETFLFLDVIACVAPIGIFFGRIANFINGELFGKPTNVSWSVIFPEVDNIPRHPSQLYEAFFEGVLLFLILISFIYIKKVKTGYCSGLFLIFYGFFRILAEQFREPDLQICYLFNYFSLGSILSFVMVIVGILILLKIKRNERTT